MNQLLSACKFISSNLILQLLPFMAFCTYDTLKTFIVVRNRHTNLYLLLF
jgi:phosphatidylglycerophosphatase A